MKKILIGGLGVILGLWLAGPVMAQSKGFNDFRWNADNDRIMSLGTSSNVSFNSNQADLYPQATSAGEGEAPGGPPKGMKPKKDAFLIIPRYQYSTSTKSTKMGNDRILTSEGGTTRGMGLTALLSREITDWLSVSFIYEYNRMNYDGSSTYPMQGVASAGPFPIKFRGNTDQTVNSHGLGVAFEADLEEYGRFKLALVQAFDFYDGYEDRSMQSAAWGNAWIPATGASNVDSSGRANIDTEDKVSIATLFYERDFQLNDKWRLMPYIGYSIAYTQFEKINSYQAGDPYMEFDCLNQFIIGGSKFNYQKGLFGFHGHLGASYMVGGERAPGFLIRLLGPQVNHAGWDLDADKTAVGWGLGVTKIIPGSAVLSFDYLGMATKSVKSHSGSATLIFPFN